PSVSIIVADDHPVVLHCVVSILQSQADMKVVAACDRGVMAVRQRAPDVAVLDIAMEGRNGLDVQTIISSEGYTTSVVFLTATAPDDQILIAVERDAKGLLLKEATTDDLVRCIRAVAAGQRWLPTDLLEAAKLRAHTSKQVSDRLRKSLTKREPS